jgi:hypothetical protein
MKGVVLVVMPIVIQEPWASLLIFFYHCHCVHLHLHPIELVDLNLPSMTWSTVLSLPPSRRWVSEISQNGCYSYLEAE